MLMIVALIFATDADVSLQNLQLVSLKKLLLFNPHRKGDDMFDMLKRMKIAPDHDNDAEKPCMWSGVTCDSARMVTSIEFNMENFMLNIDWLPSRVRTAYIVFRASSNQKFHTRKLPREIRQCAFESCHLRGSIELRTLPEKMEYLDLAQNLFSGTVYLSKLPKTIKEIYMWNNRFKKVFILNVSLPDGLQSANFGNTNDSKLPKIVCLDDDSADARVVTHNPWMIDCVPMEEYEINDWEVYDHETMSNIPVHI